MLDDFIMSYPCFIPHYENGDPALLTTKAGQVRLPIFTCSDLAHAFTEKQRLPNLLIVIKDKTYLAKTCRAAKEHDRRISQIAIDPNPGGPGLQRAAGILDFTKWLTMSVE